MGDYGESAFKYPSLSETDGFDTWTSEQLASYFATNDLEAYSELLIKHKINGKLAPLLNDTHLKEMGVKCVRDRLRFQLHIDHLQSKMRSQKRQKCIWLGQEQIFHTPVEAACFTCFSLCPRDPSTYKLMTNHLKIKTVKPARIGPIRLYFCNHYSINNIDLTYVADVDVIGKPAPCCTRMLCLAPGKDLVKIEIRGYGGTDVVGHTLTLREGDGDQVAGLIMNSVEEAQRIERE